MNAVAISLGGPPRATARFAVSPLAEMGAYLHALRGRDAHPRLDGHGDDVLDRMDPGTAIGMVRFAPLWAAYHCRLFYADLSDEEPSLSGAVAALDSIDDETFALWVVWACLDGYRPPRVTPALDSQEELVAFQASASRLSPIRGALARDLLQDRDWLRSDIEHFLRSFAEEAFAPVWDRVAPAVRQEVRHRRERLEQDEQDVFGDLPGFGLDASPWTLSIRKSTSRAVSLDGAPLHCVPTYFGNPHVLVKAEPHHDVVLHYPMRVGSTADAVEAQQRLRVLASQERLELCRLLAREELSTAELSTRLKMTAPQTSRHLRVLRGAGLVTASRRGRFVYYALDLHIAGRASADFLRGLMT